MMVVGGNIMEYNPNVDNYAKVLEAKIKKLQAENKRLTEFIEKMVNADPMWQDEWDKIKALEK